jgi:hypothetical protein
MCIWPEAAAADQRRTSQRTRHGATIERLFCVQPVDSRPGSSGQPPHKRWTTPARTWTSHSPTWTNRGQPSEPTKTTCCGRSTGPTTTSCVFSLTATRRRRIVLRSLRTMRAASPGTPAGPNCRSATLGTRTNRSGNRGDVAATGDGDGQRRQGRQAAPDRRTDSDGNSVRWIRLRRELRWPRRAATRFPSWTARRRT